MKKFALPILILMILLTIACGIGPPSEGIDYVQQMTDRANEELEENLTSGNTPEPIEKPAATSEPDDQPGPSSPAEIYGVTGDFVEYSVTGLDNGCVCLGGNMMISLEVQDDKLFSTYQMEHPPSLLKLGQTHTKETSWDTISTSTPRPVRKPV